MINQLSVVSKSKSLVILIYDICKKLPQKEKYVLIPQITRAVISIPSNLVEGQQRKDKEFIRFIHIARGSLFEVKIQLELIKELYGIPITKELQLIDEIGKMTHGLLLKLRADIQ